MTGKLIAQKKDRQRSTRLIQRKDGNVILWVYIPGRPDKQTVATIREEEIEQTISAEGLSRT